MLSFLLACFGCLLFILFLYPGRPLGLPFLTLDTLILVQYSVFKVRVLPFDEFPHQWRRRDSNS